jgi:hypothetical protein
MKKELLSIGKFIVCRKKKKLFQLLRSELVAVQSRRGERNESLNRKLVSAIVSLPYLLWNYQ